MSTDRAPATARANVVLVVDDVPDNLSMLHDGLDEAGYTVLVALDGVSALQRAEQALPDIVLLDAMMPGMDGFEVARRLKLSPRTAHIPIVFMTGLTDTEHLEAALDAGAVDYVTKPVKPREVLARMRVHLQGARQQQQTRHALDAFGYASITLREHDGQLLWQTPLARQLLGQYLEMQGERLPPEVVRWFQRGVATMQAALRTGTPMADAPRWHVQAHGARLTLRLHRLSAEDAAAGGGSEWIVIMQEETVQGVIDTIAEAFALTAKEAEVLYWVIQGKINRDIGDILGSSPMTVKKHLERIYAKLGVETRTAAASLALQRIRQRHPQFPG